MPPLLCKNLGMEVLVGHHLSLPPRPHSIALSPPSIPLYPELDALSSLPFATHPHFLFLTQSLHHHYYRPTSSPGKSPRWKEVLYCSLLKLLTELTFLQDTEEMRVGLERIYVWFTRKTHLSIDTPHRLSTPATEPESLFNPAPNRPVLSGIDAFPTLDARIKSPCKTPPPLAERVKAYIQRTNPPLSHTQKRSLGQKTASWLQRNSQTRKSDLVGQKYVRQWSIHKSKREERAVSKSEFRSNRRKTTPFSLDLPRKSPQEGTIPYVDLRPGKDSLEESSIGADSPLFCGKIQRLRRKYRLFSPDSPTNSPLSRTPRPIPASPGPDSVIDIRRKLATRQVACSYRGLSLGLSPPGPLEGFSPAFLPEGGEYLTVNPFSQLGKEKKRKRVRAK